jgi:translation initiation factor IF-1
MKNRKNNQNKFQRSFGSNQKDIKPNVIIKKGQTVVALPDAHFRVKYEDGTETVCYLAGKMKMFKIKVLVGDMVETEGDVRGGKARIIKRL